MTMCVHFGELLQKLYSSILAHRPRYDYTHSNIYLTIILLTCSEKRDHFGQMVLSCPTFSVEKTYIVFTDESILIVIVTEEYAIKLSDRVNELKERLSYIITIESYNGVSVYIVFVQIHIYTVQITLCYTYTTLHYIRHTAIESLKCMVFFSLMFHQLAVSHTHIFGLVHMQSHTPPDTSNYII